MKTIGASLLNHLASNVTTLATCWKVTAQDGTVLGFTNHTENLVVSGVTYRSPSGYTPTNIQTTAGLEVDNLDAKALLAADGLVKTEILNGKWDRAVLEFFLVNYADTTQGIVKLRKGFLGEIKLGRNEVDAEIRGLMDRYQTEVVELYSQSCRADLFDDRCGIDIAEWTLTGTVSARTSDRIFTASDMLPRFPIFTDQFNRANGTVGSSYTTLTAYPAGDLAIVGNRVRGSILDYSEEQYNVRTMPANCFSQITLSKIVGSDGYSIDLGLRLGPFSGAWFGYYALALVGGGWQINRMDNSVPTTIGSGAAAWADGDVMTFEAEGTTLRLYHNTTLLATIVDATYQSAGYASLVIEHYGADLSNLEADSFVIGQRGTAVDTIYQGGKLTWLTGNNAGSGMEVRKFTDATKLIELALPMHSTVQVGDTFSITAGCDKSHTMCQAKFGNIVNFRGEPFVPQNKAIGIAEGRAPEQGSKK